MAVTMTDSKENIMGTMSEGWLLLKLALSMIFSVLVSSLYNIVDSIFVRRIGSARRCEGARRRGSGKRFLHGFRPPHDCACISFVGAVRLVPRCRVHFFGASEEILPKVMEYAKWIIRFFPIFIAPTFIGSFVRNDGNPRLATFTVSPQIS